MSAIYAQERVLTSYTLSLQSRQEWVLLLILQVMDEIMMVLLPENSAISSSTAEGLASMASPSMKIESNQVSRYLQSIRRDHIPSFRSVASLPSKSPS